MQLTNRQKMILDMYMNKISGRQISIKMQLSKGVVYKEIEFLVNNGYTGKTQITAPVSEKQEFVHEPDKFLENMVAWELDKEQVEFILQNKDLSRTQICKKLKIKKSFLNHALQKLNITLETKLPYN